MKNKTKENNTENFVWDFNSDIPVILEDNDYNYIYGLDNSPFAQISKTDNEITFLHGDEKNSVILTSDNNGVLSKDKSYDEYGNSDYTNSVTNFGFAGEYLDEDTGLYNLRARWFEPLTGSFVSKDPAITLTGESYSYASGNPLLFTDPLGLWSETAGNDLIIGAIDGLTWIPIASTIMNNIQPGSVNICSEIFIGASIAGGLFGLGKFKTGTKIASYSITKTSHKTNINNIGHVSKNEYVKLYRAVGLDEYYDIKNINKFRIQGNAMENGKYFFTDYEQTIMFSNQDKNVVAIFSSDFNKKNWDDLPSYLFGIESSGKQIPPSELKNLFNIKQEL